MKIMKKKEKPQYLTPVTMGLGLMIKKIMNHAIQEFADIVVKIVTKFLKKSPKMTIKVKKVKVFQ